MFSWKTKQILIGSLLGDGNLQRAIKTRNAKYSEEHCLKQIDYLKWKNTFLGFKECMVTRNLLGLVVWYCDDGSYHYGNRQIFLCTNGYSKQENELMIDFFKEKYGINFVYSCERLFLNRCEAAKFVNLIKDLMPSCMDYKLGFDQARLVSARIWASNYGKNRRKLIKEHMKNYLKKYHIDNRVKHLDQFKDYYKLNKLAIQQAHKERYGKNKVEIIRKSRAYYKKNRVQILLQKKEKYLQKTRLVL